jgi:glutamine amidotransferase
MCRMAAYVGPDAPLSALLYDPPHSLERRAYQPRELIHGAVNVDGTGVAW